jgi:hypothetical protein
MIDETWVLHAQRRKKRERTLAGGNPFYRFGRQGWAEQADGDGVSQVELSVDTRGEYWGWLDKGGDRPTHISDSEAHLHAAYRAGDNTVDMYEDQRRGRGQVLRLSVRELAVVS